MKEYVYSIVCLAAAGGLACLLSPEGSGGGLKKHVKLISSVCLLCVLVSPLTGIMADLSDWLSGISAEEIVGSEELESSYEKSYFDNLRSIYGDDLEGAVCHFLKQELGIPEDECRAIVELGNEGGEDAYAPRRITVVLSGRSILRDPSMVKRVVSKAFECECLCAIE